MLGAISSILARSRNAVPDFYDVAFLGRGERPMNSAARTDRVAHNGLCISYRQLTLIM
jgi:hypothetical protein